MTVVVDTITKASSPISGRLTSRSKTNWMRFSGSRLRHSGPSGGLETSLAHSTLGNVIL